MGRNGIQRSEKVARRADRKQRRQHRVVAGAAALATVAAIGAGQAMEPAAAEASALDDLKKWSAGFNQGNPIGNLVTGLGNGLAADLAEQWRVETCLSGGARGGADCSRSNTDWGGLGIAVVLPDRIEVVPVSVYDPVKKTYDTLSGSALGDIARWLGLDVPRTMPDAPATEGSSKVIGNGFQLALAFRGGNATAISYLPLSIATAGASDGRTATSFALLGAAHAWNTGELPVTVLGKELFEIPGIKGVGCYGGLTGAYADGVGACANVLGTFDFRYRQPNGEVQFALTDPTALLSDPTGVLGDAGQEALQGILAAILSGSGVDFDGDWMSLSKDFSRLSIGGDYGLLSGNFLRLTSDYGFTGPITVDWLGSTITFRPLVEVNGESRPNRLGVPVISFGQLDTGQIVPVIHIPSYEFPFGIPATDDAVIPQQSTVARVAASAPAELATTTFADTEAPEVTADDSGTDAVDEYVGKHRAADDGYEGKHRAPDAAVDTDGSGAGADAGSADGSDDGSDSTHGGDSDSGDSDSGGSDSGSSSDSSSNSDSSSGPDSDSGGDAGSDSGSDSGSGAGASSDSGAEAA